MLQVNSQFFQVNTKVTLGDSEYCMELLVLRENAGASGESTPKVTVLNRESSTLCEEPAQATENEEEAA